MQEAILLSCICQRQQDARGLSRTGTEMVNAAIHSLAKFVTRL